MTTLKFSLVNSSCTANCAYKPTVVWTTGIRPCKNVFAQTADAATPAPGALPTDIYGPNGQNRRRRHLHFQTDRCAAWLPPMTIVRSVYMSPRNVPIVETSSKSALAATCNGTL